MFLLSVPSPASSEPSVLVFSSPPPPPPQALRRFKPASSPLSQTPQVSKFTYHFYPSLRCVAFLPPVASSFHYRCFRPSAPCGVLCRLSFEDIPSRRAILLLASQLGMAMLEDLTRDAWIIVLSSNSSDTSHPPIQCDDTVYLPAPACTLTSAPGYGLP
ncbi:hypothetical protein C8J57DRAFT_1709610 [Mycena rebaudengoi]|nr:hypothetical protein C8J57DRAFT_1731037 [Mycena rebaudengoi]KAJ7283147.1 hypothetical protein C8J57DRAFT_1709610 [Mycena rebaudengoi]